MSKKQKNLLGITGLEITLFIFCLRNCLMWVVVVLRCSKATQDR